jgi:anthranilate phosphoribosyltransferase
MKDSEKKFMEMMADMLNDAGVRHVLVIMGKDGRQLSLDGNLKEIAYMMSELTTEITEAMKKQGV